MPFTVTTDREALRPLQVGEYMGRPIYGTGGNESEIAALVEADRVIYATRFQALASDVRTDAAAAAGGLGIVTATQTAAPGSPGDVTWYVACYGLTVRLPPDVLPGSADVDTGSGSTAADRGQLTAWVRDVGCDWALRVRTITVDGDATVLGTPVVATLGSAGLGAWRSLSVLLPSGVGAGSDIACDLLYRPQDEVSSGTYSGTVYGWTIGEDDLTAVGDPSAVTAASIQLTDSADQSLSAATLTAIGVSQWTAVSSQPTAYAIVEVLTPGATVHVLRAGTSQTVAPQEWQAVAGTPWRSPHPIKQSSHSLYSTVAADVRVWFEVVVGGI
jgi:hypothetical protein